MHVMMESERGETRWRRRERSSSSERLTQREGERGESARERERAAGGQERQQAAGTESAGPPASSGDATHHQRERQRELPERSRQLRRPTHYPNPSEHAQLLGNIPPRMSPTPMSLAFAALQFALVLACSRTPPPLTRLVAHSDRTALLARVSHKIPPPSYDDDYRRNITFTSHTAAVAV